MVTWGKAVYVLFILLVFKPDAQHPNLRYKGYYDSVVMNNAVVCTVQGKEVRKALMEKYKKELDPATRVFCLRIEDTRSL